MKEIDLAYLPVIGRGEQINIICAMHGIKVNYLLSSPMGDDFDKDNEAAFGTIPWMRDHANDLELNDSMAIVQYLVAQYPGPLSHANNELAARTNMYWGWVQDYYSFVLSPFHDIITGHNEVFWRNLRLTDSLADGGRETGVANLTTLHNKRFEYLERHLVDTKAGPFLTGSDCSYADIFLYTCVRAVEETAGFGILRDACNGKPFSEFKIVAKISNAVGEIEQVKASKEKFAASPI
jgi:glutathione S-transferase